MIDLDRRSEPVSNSMIWNELLYIRRKVDALETKVLLMFGSVSAISVAISVFVVLKGQSMTTLIESISTAFLLILMVLLIQHWINGTAGDWLSSKVSVAES